MQKSWIKFILISSLLINQTSYAAQQTAVFAGGCFWGVDAVFKHVKGVISSTAGYSGGSAQQASYPLVSSGKTGHAEAVKVVFEDSQISYQQLLEIFFKVAHDPTQHHRQGPDEGPQYRSAIFYSNASQQKQAQKFINDLSKQNLFSSPIVTELNPLEAFFVAEDYHQDYAARHPDNPYIRFHDKPKLLKLQRTFPQWYRG